jgi:hypothetical protein
MHAHQKDRPHRRGELGRRAQGRRCVREISGPELAAPAAEPKEGSAKWPLFIQQAKRNVRD